MGSLCAAVECWRNNMYLTVTSCKYIWCAGESIGVHSREVVGSGAVGKRMLYSCCLKCFWSCVTGGNGASRVYEMCLTEVTSLCCEIRTDVIELRNHSSEKDWTLQALTSQDTCENCLSCHSLSLHTAVCRTRSQHQSSVPVTILSMWWGCLNLGRSIAAPRAPCGVAA